MYFRISTCMTMRNQTHTPILHLHPLVSKIRRKFSSIIIHRIIRHACAECHAREGEHAPSNLILNLVPPNILNLTSPLTRPLCVRPRAILEKNCNFQDFLLIIPWTVYAFRGQWHCIDTAAGRHPCTHVKC